MTPREARTEEKNQWKGEDMPDTTYKVYSRYGGERVWGKMRLPWTIENTDMKMEIEALANIGDEWGKRAARKLWKIIPEGDSPVFGR
jgi:hypothetical protein